MIYAFHRHALAILSEASAKLAAPMRGPRYASTHPRASGRTKLVYAYPKAFRQYNKRYGDGNAAMQMIRVRA